MDKFLDFLKLFRSLHLAGSVVTLLLLYLGRKIIFGLGFFAEGAPQFSWVFLFSSVCVVITAYLFFRFLTSPTAKDSPPQFAVNQIGGLLSGWMVVLGASLVSTAVFIVSPELFTRLAREGNIVETASATLNFTGGTVLMISALKIYRHKQPHKTITLIGLFTGAAFFFLMGLEEISWFQRVFDLKTPAAFAANEQGEINFHNFATNKLETCFYFSAFCFLTALPVFHSFRMSFESGKAIHPFLPSLELVPCGLIIASFNYDMWNAPLTQLAFFSSLLLVLFLITHLQDTPRFRKQLVFAVCTGILCQLTFLIFGHQFVRLWDITEYKELLISISLLVYALHVRKEVQSNHSILL